MNDNVVKRYEAFAKLAKKPADVGVVPKKS